MTARVSVLLAFMCSLLISCTVSEKGPRKVLKPEGEAVHIVLSDERRYSGELLCVTDTTIYLLSLPTILQLPLAAVRSVKVEGYGLVKGKDMAESLKPYSRYPNGLSEAQWRELLDHYGQKEISGP
jgi:hypothetical protein